MAISRYCARCMSTFDGDPTNCPNLGCGNRRPESGWGGLLARGDLLDRRYRVEHPLAVGGAGITYLAREVDDAGRSLGPLVAVKVLYQARAAGPFLRRLSTEAQILQELAHPNIVELLGFVHRTGHEPYLVTRFEEGGNLSQHLDRHGPLPARVAAGIVRQVLTALDTAHQRGVVHRDLKPDNVLLRTHCQRIHVPEVRVADFGIAKVVGGQLHSNLTRAGAFVGTPEYAAPEQFLGQTPTPATDVFAAGGLMFYLLSARPPFLFSVRQDVDQCLNELLEQLPLHLPPVRDATPDEQLVLQTALDLMAREKPEDRSTIHRVLQVLQPLLDPVDLGKVGTLEITARPVVPRELHPSPPPVPRSPDGPKSLADAPTPRIPSRSGHTGPLPPPEERLVDDEDQAATEVTLGKNTVDLFTEEAPIPLDAHLADARPPAPPTPASPPVGGPPAVPPPLPPPAPVAPPPLPAAAAALPPPLPPPRPISPPVPKRHDPSGDTGFVSVSGAAAESVASSRPLVPATPTIEPDPELRDNAPDTVPPAAQGAPAPLEERLEPRLGAVEPPPDLLTPIAAAAAAAAAVVVTAAATAAALAPAAVPPPLPTPAPASPEPGPAEPGPAEPGPAEPGSPEPGPEAGATTPVPAVAPDPVGSGAASPVDAAPPSTTPGPAAHATPAPAGRATPAPAARATPAPAARATPAPAARAPSPPPPEVPAGRSGATTAAAAGAVGCFGFSVFGGGMALVVGVALVAIVAVAVVAVVLYPTPPVGPITVPKDEMRGRFEHAAPLGPNGNTKVQRQVEEAAPAIATACGHPARVEADLLVVPNGDVIYARIEDRGLGQVDPRCIRRNLEDLRLKQPPVREGIAHVEFAL